MFFHKSYYQYIITNYQYASIGSDYLNHCWPSLLTHMCITRPKWFNECPLIRLMVPKLIKEVYNEVHTKDQSILICENL